MRFLACAPLLVAVGVTGVAAQPAPQWVTVTGQVVLPANVPVPVRKALAVAAGNGCPAGLLDESVIVNPKNRGVKNVVVWLRPDDVNDAKAALTAKEIHPADAKRKRADVVIDQRACAFDPHVAVGRVGDTVVVKNSGAGLHNFFWSSANNGEFGIITMPGQQQRFAQPLERERSPIQFKCTIHPWMVGYMRVFDHPYYAVTDDDGKFTIKDAPAGNYRLVYWHEQVGFLGKAPGRFGVLTPIAPGPNGVMDLKPTDFPVQ